MYVYNPTSPYRLTKTTNTFVLHKLKIKHILLPWIGIQYGMKASSQKRLDNENCYSKKKMKNKGRVSKSLYELDKKKKGQICQLGI